MVVWWHDGVGETSMVSGDDDVRDNGGRYRSNDVMMMRVVGLKAKRNDGDDNRWLWCLREGDGGMRKVPAETEGMVRVTMVAEMVMMRKRRSE